MSSTIWRRVSPSVEEAISGYAPCGPVTGDPPRGLGRRRLIQHNQTESPQMRDVGGNMPYEPNSGPRTRSGGGGLPYEGAWTHGSKGPRRRKEQSR
jgi:hypothetical protein